MRSLLLLSWLLISLVGCDRAPSPPIADIEPATLHFKVSGMVCEACEQAITETVGSMPGVVSVKAAHVTGDVDVRTTDRDQRAAIAAAIEKLNYRVAK